MITMNNPGSHYPKNTRLRGYDYAQNGAYFLTVVTAGRAHLFGEIGERGVGLSAYGEIAREEWLRSAILRPELYLGEFVVMPNHIHGIVVITDAQTQISADMVDCAHRKAQLSRAKRSIGSLVAGFKSAVTARINAVHCSTGISVWQRGYYDHVIRNEYEFDRITEYIALNPFRWAEDSENISSPL